MKTTMKTFLRTFVALFSLFLITNQVWAQEEKADSRGEKIKAQKIAFFTEKIGLTPQEAESFWPVYNRYWQQKNKITAARKKDMSYFSNNGDSMTKSELETYAQRYVEYELKLGQLIVSYHEKFCSLLPIDKVMKLYMADYEFKTYLLHLIRDGGKKKE
ncbi:MAG: hypothetical protein R6U66_12570 [Bacteroidales bacterium]|jgi:hypothetical protein